MGVRATDWWERRELRAVLLLLCALPLLWPAIPPLLDLPGHMGRYHVALNLSASPALQRFYDYHWSLVGNLGVDVLILPLGSVFGIEFGTKLIVLAIPLLTAAGFLWTAALVHGRLQPTAPLALVFIYAYPFHYGFVNFCLAMAVVSVTFALWIRLCETRSAIHFGIFAVLAVVVWIAHAVCWTLLCVMCGTYELWRQLHAERRNTWRAIAAAAVAVLPLLTPLIFMALAPSGVPTELGGWLDVRSLAKWLLALNRDRWIAYDLACTLLLAVVLGLAAVRRLGLSVTPGLAWPALALFGVYLFAPDSINGSANVSARIIPWAASYAFLSIDAKSAGQSLKSRWATFALAFFAIRMMATSLSLLIYGQAYDRVLSALDAVPDGSAIAVLARNTCRPTLGNWANSRLQHLGGVAILRRNAFVNDQWDSQALQLLTVRYGEAEPFTHSPSELVSLERCEGDFPPLLPETLDRLPRGAFDFVWMLDIPEAQRARRPWLVPVYKTPESALYAVKGQTP